jgi:hypothetical protein
MYRQNINNINLSKIQGREHFGTIFADHGLKMKRMLPIVLIVLYSSLAAGEIYRWTDERGSVHYTDDFTKIPDRYQSSIQKLEGVESGEPTKKESEVSSKPKEAPKDRLGRGEEYWKGRVNELKNKMKTLEERSESLRSKHNELTIKYNDSKSSAERGILRTERGQIKSEIDQVKAEIEETRILLERKIPEEAETYNAKPDWIK